MYLLGLGLVLLLLKWAEFGSVANWAWWVVLTPFGLAALWWAWADGTGYTKRKAMEREEERKAARLERQRENLGLGTKRRR